MWQYQTNVACLNFCFDKHFESGICFLPFTFFLPFSFFSLATLLPFFLSFFLSFFPILLSFIFPCPSLFCFSFFSFLPFAFSLSPRLSLPPPSLSLFLFLSSFYLSFFRLLSLNLSHQSFFTFLAVVFAVSGICFLLSFFLFTFSMSFSNHVFIAVIIGFFSFLTFAFFLSFFLVILYLKGVHCRYIYVSLTNYRCSIPSIATKSKLHIRQPQPARVASKASYVSQQPRYSFTCNIYDTHVISIYLDSSTSIFPFSSINLSISHFIFTSLFLIYH